MKHIGLVLSGGMGKGAYQIGALNALKEYFSSTDFECVSAASIGTLNAYTYLTDNLEKAVSLWKTIHLQNEKRFITSILKSDFLQQVVPEIVSDKKIRPSFYTPLLDLRSRELSYYNLSEIPPNEIEPYLSASIAMPFYNKGIKIGTSSFFDGAIADNIPIYPVMKNRLDYVICIYFDNMNYIFENYDLDKRIIKITFPDNKILSNSVYLTSDSISKMIEEGYQRTKQVLNEFFSEGTDDTERILNKIKEENLKKTDKIVRITGDVVVTNINKFVRKKIIKRKKIMEGKRFIAHP